MIGAFGGCGGLGRGAGIGGAFGPKICVTPV